MLTYTLHRRWNISAGAKRTNTKPNERWREALGLVQHYSRRLCRQTQGESIKPMRGSLYCDSFDFDDWIDSKPRWSEQPKTKPSARWREALGLVQHYSRRLCRQTQGESIKPMRGSLYCDSCDFDDWIDSNPRWSEQPKT